MTRESATGKARPLLPLSRPCTPRDIVDHARQFGPACIEALAEEALDGSGASRISAANSLLDRGFGKAGQSPEISGPDNGVLLLPLSINPVLAETMKALKAMPE